MAADGGPSHAAQVCYVCKTRKKRCDKVLPCCGNCSRKGLDCVYGVRPSPPNHVAPTAVSTPKSPSSLILLEPAVSETNLYFQAHRIIRATGQFVDDISVSYFHTFHRFLPVVSRARFHDHLITLGAAPAADFSVLLLSICLITFSPDVEQRSRRGGSASISRKSLHLAARSLLAQVQTSFSPSVHLIQASLLLSFYDYAHGQPDDAFASIAACARMAYATGIHLLPHCAPQLPPTPSSSGLDAETEPGLLAEEAANTWWGIIFSERMFVCDVKVPDQPLVSVVPEGDASLPIEPAALEQSDSPSLEPPARNSVSSYITVEVGPFARAAQAACLIDQVLKAFNITDLNTRFIELDGLSVALQNLLAVVMQQYRGQVEVFCGAIGAAIRGLFILHSYILSQRDQPITAKFRSPEDWCQRSQVVLDSITKMCVDIADYHQTLPGILVGSRALGCAYIFRAALRNVRRHEKWKDDPWLRSAEEQLRASLDWSNVRWSMGDFYPR